MILLTDYGNPYKATMVTMMRFYRYTGKQIVLPDWTIEKENIWNEDEFRVDDVSFDMSEIAKFLFFQLMFWGCPQKKHMLGFQSK